MKRTVVSLLLAAIFAVGTWFVFSNSHIDILPCKKAEMNFQTDKLDPERDTTCSLLGIYQAKTGPETAKLTPVGWAVGVGVIIIIPGLIGLFIGRKIIKP